MHDGKVSIKTSKRMNAEDASDAMIRSGRDMNRRVQATGAVTFKKPGQEDAAVKSPTTTKGS